MVEEIQSEIKRILSDEGYDVNRPLADLFVELNNDPRFLFEDSDKGREAILEEYRRINDETYAMLPDYFNELPKAKVVVKGFQFFLRKCCWRILSRFFIGWIQAGCLVRQFI